MLAGVRRLCKGQKRVFKTDQQQEQPGAWHSLSPPRLHLNFITTASPRSTSEWSRRDNDGCACQRPVDTDPFLKRCLRAPRILDAATKVLNSSRAMLRLSTGSRVRILSRTLVQRQDQRQLSHFRVIEHVVPCQHTRQYPGGAEPGQHSALRLSVKQYIPKQPPEGWADRALTVIGASGNGLPRELMEPFWDDFYEQMQKKGQAIRSIWVADQAHQGASGVLNETILGNDPSWFDHARDLLFFINQKQDNLPQPLFGIGHSMGASQLTALALLHPTLMQGLVLMDPVIQAANPSKPFALASTYRRDLWKSRAQAKESFLKSKFYQSWDSRVLDNWIEYGLRELPTEVYPEIAQDSGDIPVTLTTAKHEEVYSFLRPLYNGQEGVAPEADLGNYFDLNPEDTEPDYPFYRPECAVIFRKLPELRPPVTYIFGKESPLAGEERNEHKLSLTGSGVGGSGGRRHDKVTGTVLDCTHFVPMEMPGAAASSAAEFVDREARRWWTATDEFQRRWQRRPRPQRVMLDDTWRAKIGPKPSR